MHVFFDTVWKLHIGEIPEKPDPKNYLYPGPLVSDLKQHEQAIAAIKQNALIVGNPEIITTDEVPGEPGKPYKPGEFYFWLGGYETIKCSTCGKEWNDETSWYCSNSFHLKAPAVATLTPPHEKTLNA